MIGWFGFCRMGCGELGGVVLVEFERVGHDVRADRSGAEQ